LTGEHLQVALLNINTHNTRCPPARSFRPVCMG